MATPFERTWIGNTVLPNRLLMAPMKTGYGNVEGEATQRQVDFYRRRAAGGVGLITLEPMYVHPSGKELPNQLGIHNDKILEALRHLVNQIHEAGAKVAVHLTHAGRMANPAATSLPLVSASATPCRENTPKPRTLSKSAIEFLVECFAQAARRARQIGVDIVELQCGHGYLIGQFLSPLVNKRRDEYGGSLENRLRFGVDILKAVKAELGAAIPVICRLSAREYIPEGLNLWDSTRIAVALEAAGADAIHVSGGTVCESPAWYFQHSALPAGEFLEDAQAIKRAVTIPVIAVGRLGTPDRVMEALGDGGVDMAALGRPLIADPDFPLKMQSGNSDEICSCGACLQGCLSMVKAGKGLSCVINPMAGREGEICVQTAARRKKVMVVGGGPAGLEASITAAARGHQVDLYERGQLGGQFRLACAPPMKEGMRIPYNFLLSRLKEEKVRLHLGTNVDVRMVMDCRPDVVVVATGAEPVIPPIEGCDQIESMTGQEVLEGSRRVGTRVLIVGGGMVGMETAEFLASHGKQVTVIEMLGDIAHDMEPITRGLLMKRIAHMSVDILTNTLVKRFEHDRVIVERNNVELILPAFDSIVVSVGTQSVDTLSVALRREGFDVYTVGDCRTPRHAIDAIREGFEAGLTI